MMKKLNRILALSLPLAVGSFVVACDSKLSPIDEDGPHASGLKQLVQKSFVCDVNEDRIPMIVAEYGGNLKGGSSGHKVSAKNALANLPSEYLNYVFKRHNVVVTLKNVGGSTRGMTSSSNGGGAWHPNSIWVGQMTGNFDPLAHEIGHAMQHYLKYTFPDFKSDLSAMYGLMKSNGESNHMRGYAKSSATEYWAEIFDSFYCSQASRDNMKEKMPKTLEFAQKYLIDPSDLEGNTGDDSILGAELKLDTDHDGVSNYYDKCADTPEDTEVLFSSKHYGCSQEQSGTPAPVTPVTPDGERDEDADGIPDSLDKCLGTPAGAKVWKEKTGEKAKWYGCTGGQTPNN